jgi:hypothetical protein
MRASTFVASLLMALAMANPVRRADTKHTDPYNDPYNPGAPGGGRPGGGGGAGGGGAGYDPCRGLEGTPVCCGTSVLDLLGLDCSARRSTAPLTAQQPVSTDTYLMCSRQQPDKRRQLRADLRF